MTDTLRLYVAGFLFSNGDVLLVQKMKPDWQKGYWNGVGGRVEPGEAPLDAMAREFVEETTIDVGKDEWRGVCQERGPGYMTHFYAARRMAQPHAPSLNDAGEPLMWREVRFLHQVEVLGNLRWLIPMALDWRAPKAVVGVVADIKERPTW